MDRVRLRWLELSLCLVLLLLAMVGLTGNLEAFKPSADDAQRIEQIPSGLGGNASWALVSLNLTAGLFPNLTEQSVNSTSSYSLVPSWVLQTVSIAAIVVLAAFLVLSVRRRRSSGVSYLEAEEVEEIQESPVMSSMVPIGRWHSDDPSRNAVAEAYGELCEHIRAMGSSPLGPLTPREVEALAVGSLGLPRDMMRSVTATFEKARYDGEPLSKDEVEQAVSTCRRLASGETEAPTGGMA